MPESGFIDLYNDIRGNTLIEGPTPNGGWNATLFTLSSMKIYQGSKLPLRWYPLTPTGPFKFAYAGIEGLTLDVVVGVRAGAEAIKARQNSWAASSDGNYLEAVLNLNTTELNDLIASADTYETYFEINMSVGGSERPTYQEKITIQSVVKGPNTATSLPTAAVEYLTAAQQDARFVRWTGNRNGAAIELNSDDGASQRLIGVRNDKTALDEVL